MRFFFPSFSSKKLLRRINFEPGGSLTASSFMVWVAFFFPSQILILSKDIPTKITLTFQYHSHHLLIWSLLFCFLIWWNYIISLPWFLSIKISFSTFLFSSFHFLVLNKQINCLLQFPFPSFLFPTFSFPSFSFHPNAIYL